MPRANTGSTFLNFVSDTFTLLLQFERRFDHWLRLPFDATLRDPMARLVTALINRKRPNEGLKIEAEIRRRMGSCAENLSCTTIYPQSFGMASTPSRTPIAPGSGFPGPALTSRRTSTIQAS